MWNKRNYCQKLHRRKMTTVPGMDQNVFKAPRAKKRPPANPKPQTELWPGRNVKRRRTKEDFIQFCNIILEYTNYETLRNEDARLQQSTSPMASGGSPVDSYNSDSSANASPSETRQASPAQPLPFLTHPTGGPPHTKSADDDSFELITCFCMKPFAGRPMIECHECLTWIHLSCAKIRKNNIPEEFTCQKCKDAKLTTRKSTRQRVEKQNLDA